jgi:sulfur carrier protein ThiS
MTLWRTLKYDIPGAPPSALGRLPVETNIKIVIVAPPTLGIPGLAPDGSLEIPDGASVDSIVSTFAIDRELRRHLPVAVNGCLVDRSHQLREGDELTILFPAVGG